MTIVIGWLGSSIEQFERRMSAQRNEELNMKLQRLQHDYFAQINTFDTTIDHILVIYIYFIPKNTRRISYMDFQKLMKVAIGVENIILYVLEYPDKLMATEYAEACYEEPFRFLPKKLQ